MYLNSKSAFKVLQGSENLIKSKLRGSLIGETVRLLKRIIQFTVIRISYSQESEDLLSSVYLPERKIEYLDVGAGHPILGSNTFKFYLRGGRGLVVDPITTNLRLFRLFRPRDKRIQAFVSDSKDCEVDFFETYPLGYSSNVLPDQKFMEKQKIILLKNYKVPLVHLQNILPPLESDKPFLLSIDAEGQDLNILKTNDWVKSRPRVVIAETLTKAERIESLEFMESKDYIRVSYSILSSVYVAKEYLDKSSEILHF